MNLPSAFLPSVAYNRRVPTPARDIAPYAVEDADTGKALGSDSGPASWLRRACGALGPGARGLCLSPGTELGLIRLLR